MEKHHKKTENKKCEMLSKSSRIPINITREVKKSLLRQEKPIEKASQEPKFKLQIKVFQSLESPTFFLLINSRTQYNPPGCKASIVSFNRQQTEKTFLHYPMKKW